MSPSLHDVLHAATDLFRQNRPLLPMYLHLIVSAAFPIYIGAHGSLSRPSSAAKPKKTSAEDGDDEEEEEPDQHREGLTPTDAIVFPVVAGIVLTLLYFAIKQYGAAIINKLLGAYFAVVGVYSVAKLFNDALAIGTSFLAPTYYYDHGHIWTVDDEKRQVVALGTSGSEKLVRTSPLASLLGRLEMPTYLKWVWAMRGLVHQKFVLKAFAKDMFKFRIICNRLNAFSALLGAAAISYSYFVGSPWWLTNVQGFAVSYGALQLMTPTSFTTGTLILTGLFFYDIWAVFFTPLMVAVATNLDVPIKLVFPRPEEPSTVPGQPPKRAYSMLGLGDIVLPGLMIALALRFDLYMFYLRKQTRASKSQATASNESDRPDQVEKAPYVSVTGHWGDKFWLARASSSQTQLLPASLTTVFPKPYFTASMIGYVVGLVVTLIFMSIFSHAQPALLYLVPAVLVSLWCTGVARSEVKHMLNFTEAIDLEPEEGDYSENKEQEGKPNQQSLSSYIAEFWSGKEVPSAIPKPDKKAEAADGTSEEHYRGGPKDEDSKQSGAEQDTVFSLTISRHKKVKGGERKSGQ